MVNKNVVLVCPGVFTDRADWEGVPLMTVLGMAKIKDVYNKVEFHSVDGFTLPKEHGYPCAS